MNQNNTLQKILRILKNKFLIFPYIIFFLVLILSAFKIHGSSVGMYNQYIYGTTEDKDLLAGQPRPIRSDEWIVETPLIVSQSQNNYEHKNSLIGTGEEVSLIYTAPSNHWINIFRPQNIGFYFLPVENAFALRWWLRGAFIILSAYLLLLVITRKDLTLSICGSLILFFTPFVQWWYSVMALESISYFLFIMFFFTQVIKRTSLKRRIIFTLGLSYFTLCFAFILYPPFQVPLVIFGILFGIGYLINNRYFIERKYLLPIAICSVLFIGIVGSVLALFYHDFQDLIQIISNTSYPGQRIIKGGGYSTVVLFSGVFDYLLKNKYVQVPAILSNQSEAANFFFITIFTAPVMLYIVIKKYLVERKIDFIFVAILTYFTICMLWFFGGLSTILGKVLFLKLVQETRLIIGLGIANFVGAFYFITHANIKQIARNIDYRITTFILSIFVFITYFYVGYFYKINYPAFLSSTKVIVAISLTTAVITLFLLWSKERLFVLSLLAFSLFSSFMVNPLYVGLRPLINSELSQKLKSIEESHEGRDTWAVFDNGFYGEYLVANGMHSLDSTHTYPQLDLWKILDEDKSDYVAYNRYAHVLFVQNSDVNAVEFSNPAGDAVNVSIHPCNEKFNQLNTRFYIFAEEKNYQCLRLKEKLEYPALKAVIYEKI